MTSQLNGLKEEEEQLAQGLANSRKTYEEAKRKRQLEEPKLIVEAKQRTEDCKIRGP